MHKRICTVCCVCVCVCVCARVRTYWLKAVHLSLEPGPAELACCVHSRPAFYQQSPFTPSAARPSTAETYMDSLAYNRCS